jgi:SAM-dependent methyltransferase
MQNLLYKLRRIRFSIASSGLGRTLSDLLIHALSYRAEKDASFDSRYGTDTAGRVQPSELGIADDSVREKAILYLASPAGVTRWMLKNARVDPVEFSFVDLGCGKGRVLLLASELRFRQVIGVEISDELCAIARRNAETFQPRRSQITVHNGDATRFDFPDSNLLIHLYHPFDPELTLRIFTQLGDQLANKPRRVVVAYLLYTAAVPAVEAIFARIPWLSYTRYENSVTGEYDWLLYESEPARP